MSPVRIVVASALIAVLSCTSGVVLAQHSAPAGEVLCAGSRTGGKCDLVWLNYSVESRYSNAPGQPHDQDKVNCPRGTSSRPECYQSADEAKGSSSGWGTAAGTTLVPRTTAGPVDLLGVAYGTGAADARVWVGIRGQGAGSGAVAAAAGRNAAGDPYACLTLYGNDETDGHRISGALADSGLSDDRSDYDTDAQFCGEFLRGPL